VLFVTFVNKFIHANFPAHDLQCWCLKYGTSNYNGPAVFSKLIHSTVAWKCHLNLLSALESPLSLYKTLRTHQLLS